MTILWGLLILIFFVYLFVKMHFWLKKCEIDNDIAWKQKCLENHKQEADNATYFFRVTSNPLFELENLPYIEMNAGSIHSFTSSFPKNMAPLQIRRSRAKLVTTYYRLPIKEGGRLFIGSVRDDDGDKFTVLYYFPNLEENYERNNILLQIPGR